MVYLYYLISRQPRSTFFPYTTLFRSDRHGHGEDVVGEEGRARDLRGHRPDVVAHHDVGAAAVRVGVDRLLVGERDRKSTRLNSSHANNSYAVFCLKKILLYDMMLYHR